MRGLSRMVALTHDLIARTPDVAHWRAQHMHKTREREQQEYGEPQEDMHLEDDRRIGDVA